MVQREEYGPEGRLWSGGKNMVRREEYSPEGGI